MLDTLAVAASLRWIAEECAPFHICSGARVIWSRLASVSWSGCFWTLPFLRKGANRVRAAEQCFVENSAAGGELIAIVTGDRIFLTAPRAMN
jgi:hypothetical protein